jgi:hypothetical protein
MVTSKEYVFDFADLKLLNIVCENCHTETIIDISNPSSKLPIMCHPCKSNFDDKFKNALGNFQSAYLTLAKSSKERPLLTRIRVRCELKE